MKKIPCPVLWLLFVLGMLLPDRLEASVMYDRQILRLEFAARELKDTLKESGRENLQVALIDKPDES